VGAIPITMHQSGVDYYAFSGQKWLCGPEGTGGLFVRRDRQDELQPVVVGRETADFAQYRANDVDSFVPKTGAAKYEHGSTYRPLTAGLSRSLAWITEDVGTAAVFESISRLSSYCLARAHAISGLEVLTPASQAAGLVALRLAGVDTADAVGYLAERGISVRSIPENGALRISCGFYNTTEDVDLALSAIAELVAG
jgi:L-cysteine/cystine lyase